MTRLIHTLFGLTYVLGGIVLAGVLSRFSPLDGTMSWLAGAGTALVGAQTHMLVARIASERRMAASLAAMGQAQSHIIDELTAARAARADLEATMTELGVEMGRALQAEATRLDDAVVSLNRRIDIGPPPEGLVRNPPSRDAQAAPTATVGLSAEDIHAAVEDGRIELVAQPIVTLPQRRPAHYEILSRLRTSAGDIAPAATWMDAASESGVLVGLDAFAAQRGLSMAAKFSERGRHTGVFCNLSPATVDDEAAFGTFMQAIAGKTNSARDVVLEMRQHDVRQLSLTGVRNMRRLADYGFRFSLDNVRDVDLDLGELRASSVRFIKIKGDTLMDMIRGGGALGVGGTPEVSVHDFPELVSRAGLSLIAEKVESETTVVEALDYPIPLGQGNLFGAPRPVRADLLAEAA